MGIDTTHALRILLMANRQVSLPQRLALFLVLATVLGTAACLYWETGWRSEIPFLPHLSSAEWIVYPSAPEGATRPRVELSTQFRRSFVLKEVPAQAAIGVAGFHRYVLSVNRTVLEPPQRPIHNWKQPDCYEAAKQLRVGTNQITVTVSNTNGPPVLWFSLNAPGLKLSSDEDWQASYAGATWRAARYASEPDAILPGGPLYIGKPAWESRLGCWALLVLFVALSAGAFWLLNQRPLGTGRLKECAPMIGLVAAWGVLFANNLGELPTLVGFDVTGHLPYIRFLQEHHRLPWAGEGWEMWQPPLYYMLGAVLLKLLSLSASHTAGIVALRTLGLGIGIVHFVLVWASLRLLFPGERSKPMWGLALVACLPPMLYLSQYVTNEALAAMLVSASVYLTLQILRAGRVSWRLCVGLGLCLGAALLTKSSAILAFPAVFGALAWKAIQRGGFETQSPPTGGEGCQPRARANDLWEWGCRLAVILSVCAAVCGWHYARAWAHSGDPLSGVLGPRGGFSWWQDPGYRTSEFYLRFGEVFFHPWFSALNSFGDGVYSTLWGDGLLGGAAGVEWRPPWNYDLMGIAYWLALLPAAAVVTGAVLALLRFLRQPSAEWFLVLSLGFLTSAAVIHMSLAVPYYCMVKAFYGLPALVTLGACGALGLEGFCRRSGKLRPLICILFGVWALTTYAAFWIPRSSLEAWLMRAGELADEGQPAQARTILEGGAGRPLSVDLRSRLATLLQSLGAEKAALQQAELVLKQEPNDPGAHAVLSVALTQQQRVSEAITHACQALDLEPGRGQHYQRLAGLLAMERQWTPAIQTARAGLALAPFNADLRLTLGLALLVNGERDEGITQLQWVHALEPDSSKPLTLLAMAYTEQGMLEQARSCLQEAARLEPTNAGIHCRLATALKTQHRMAEAITHYEEALRLEPNLAEALNDLAWIRATNPQAELRDGAQAVRLAKRAFGVTGNAQPALLITLAAAHAEAGQFDEAVATARKAREVAVADGQHELAKKSEHLIGLFSARQPYREEPDSRLK